MLVDIGQELHFLKLGHRCFWVVEELMKKVGIGGEVGSKVQIMKKRVFLVADVDERGVQARHELFNFGHVNVTDGVGKVAALLLQRNQAPFLQEGNGDLLRLHVDD
jgi:hypothetical protein